MNFVNPFIEVYFNPEKSKAENNIPFYKEVCWVYLKNIDNRLKLFQHRLNIEILDAAPLRKTMKFGSIYRYSLMLDHPFNAMSLAHKRRKLLDIVYEAFTVLGNENNWDLNVIEDAYQKSITQLDRFEYYTESKLNRNKKISSQIELTLNGNWLSIHANIYFLDTNEKQRIKLLDSSEDNLSWRRMFKEYGWYDNVRFGLKFLKGDLWIVINTESGKVEEITKPNKFDLKKIETYLEELKKPAYNSGFA